MIQTLAHTIARRLKVLSPEIPASIEVLRFSLEAILNAVFIVAFTVLISLFTGHLSEVVIMMVTFAALRQVTGGIHLKSGMFCVIATTLCFTVLSFLKCNNFVVGALTIASIIITAIFAPSRIENQTRISKKYYPLLKIIAVLLISINLLFSSSAAALAIILQCLTLIKKRG